MTVTPSYAMAARVDGRVVIQVGGLGPDDIIDDTLWLDVTDFLPHLVKDLAHFKAVVAEEPDGPDGRRP